MYDATSKNLGDKGIVTMKALYEEKLPSMAGVDVCYQTSPILNARARGATTITYLAACTQCPCPMIVVWATTAPVGTRPRLAAMCSPLLADVL